MQKFIFKSYCKVNLSLRILKKISYSFHRIQSLITFCNIYDTITISEIDGYKDRVTFFGNFKKKINFQINTITKTLQLLRKEKKLDKYFKILVRKNIPHGSGLGGGSSNAASLINYLNFKYNLGLTKKRKHYLANKIGSDVSLCLVRKNSLITGKKDQIVRFERDFKLNLLIVFPNVNCSTKKVYLANKIYSAPNFFSNAKFKNKKRFTKLLINEHNDLEKTVIKMYPQIQELINTISHQKGCYFSRLTGSGSACIGAFSNLKFAKRARTLIKRNFPKYWIAVSKTI